MKGNMLDECDDPSHESTPWNDQRSRINAGKRKEWMRAVTTQAPPLLDCHCINADCVRNGGYVECVCYPEYGKYSFNECKACHCGAGFNCTFEPDIFDDNKKCICTDGYEEKNGTCTGPCTGDPCLNGGTCVNSDGSFYCRCRNGYFGNVCQDKGACADEPCKNGGMCIDINDEYHCICQRGFSGRNCEIGAFVNSSTDDPFETSTSGDPDRSTVPGSTYPPGECDCGPKSNYCELDNYGRPRCYCKSGYAQVGNFCSECYCGEKSTGCSFDEDGNKACLCSTGYSQKDSICKATCNHSNECLNDGFCELVRPDTKFCRCARNFKGDQCETHILCENLNANCKAFGAICKPVGDSAKCECPPNKGYQWRTGKCEDICDSQKCINGLCIVDGLDYICRCVDGFTGRHCELRRGKQENLGLWIPIIAASNGFLLFLLIGTCICLCKNRRSKENVV